MRLRKSFETNVLAANRQLSRVSSDKDVYDQLSINEDEFFEEDERQEEVEARKGKESREEGSEEEREIGESRGGKTREWRKG